MVSEPLVLRTLWLRPAVLQWVVVTLIVLTVGWWLANTGAQSPAGRLVGNLPLSILLSIAIGSFAWTLFPLVMRVTAGWHQGPAWAFYLATMVFCAAVGTASVAAVTFLVGVIDVSDIGPATWLLLRQNVVSTVPVTIVIGIAMILLGTTRARIEATELSLRTQQLERERAEKLAAKAQLASLSSRVQPHFLFNTLNSISGLIRQQPAQAEAMIAHLSSLLRSSLDDKDLIDLTQELKLVTDYLEIQRTRLGDRLHYDFAVAADASGKLPPFSLQTLVENSLKHVAGRRPDDIAVRIDVRRDVNMLSLAVTDDGPGFDPDALRAGHGLDILQHRLRGIFGDAATLEFDRQPRSMTVRLRVPIR